LALLCSAKTDKEGLGARHRKLALRIGGSQTMKPAQPKSVITAEHVNLAEEPARINLPHAGHVKGEPRIELIRDGDIIRAIEVICSCGERIRLRCDYE